MNLVKEKSRTLEIFTKLRVNEIIIFTGGLPH
jgi:hypothetical protein